MCSGEYTSTRFSLRIEFSRRNRPEGTLWGEGCISCVRNFPVREGNFSLSVSLIYQYYLENDQKLNNKKQVFQLKVRRNIKIQNKQNLFCIWGGWPLLNTKSVFGLCFLTLCTKVWIFFQFFKNKSWNTSTI